VEQLAEVLGRKDPPGDWSSLVVMQRGGSRPSLFLVHTFGGNVLDYRELVRLLGPEQPVYGLQTRNAETETGAPRSRLEDMAAHYVEAMRVVQPAGPYYLGGFCLAGVVAFEMARQLHEQGEPVALLAIVDASAPVRSRPRAPLWHPSVAISVLRNLPCWMRNNLPHRYGYFLRRIPVRVWGETRTAWRRLIWRQAPSDAMTLEDFLGDPSHIPERARKRMELHFRAFHSYRPQPYQGRITLFRAEALPLLRPYDTELGWGKLAAGGVNVKIVAHANHELLREPHVEKLAVHLRTSLAEAQTGTN
jgi:thioesterase domain-containing protein